MVPALAAMSALFLSACERAEQPDLSFKEPATTDVPVTELSVEGVARMLSGLPLTIAQVREVHCAVSSSSSNGYDEEYPFANLISSPGAGVGDELLQTRTATEYPDPLRDLLSSVDIPATRSGSLSDALSNSGMQIYWPYSEDWDGKSLPVITFNPEETSSAPRLQDGSNVGFLREQLPNGSWIVKEVTVDEEYARNHPVWVINRNEDATYLTPQMVEALYPDCRVGMDSAA